MAGPTGDPVIPTMGIVGIDSGVTKSYVENESNDYIEQMEATTTNEAAREERRKVSSGQDGTYHGTLRRNRAWNAALRPTSTFNNRLPFPSPVEYHPELASFPVSWAVMA